MVAFTKHFHAQSVSAVTALIVSRC